MKKILALAFLGIFASSCASKIQDLKYPNIKKRLDKTAEIYFSPELATNYKISSKTQAYQFNIGNHSSEKPGGIESDKNWNQNIGQLSINQFTKALDLAFSEIKIVNTNPKKAVSTSYLVVPTILNKEISINDLLRSYIKLRYKISVYDKSGKLIYSEETEVKEKGKYKGFTGVGIGFVPIMGELNLKPNESSMVFEAISNGVDKVVNKMIKSDNL